MPRTDVESMRTHAIGASLDRIARAMEGLNEDEINWSPEVDGANSLATMAMHVYANIEENILGTLLGQDVQRDRDAEFGQGRVAVSSVIARGDDVLRRIREALSTLSPSDLERQCEHPRRGILSGREVLLVAGRHAAEHVGHAELTRALILARRGQAE